MTPTISDFPIRSVSTSPRTEWRGRYENDAYGYSVIIPKGFVGYSGPDGFPQHGFGIVIGTDDRASYASVSGYANTLEHASPAAAAAQDLEYIKSDATLIGEAVLKPSKLGRLPAVYLMARFRCNASGREYMETTIIAMSARTGLVYEISLSADPSRFNADRHVWDALVGSFADRPRRIGMRRVVLPSGRSGGDANQAGGPRGR